MVFRRTRKNFARNYNKLKYNTTMIERNVRESVNTGLDMMDNIEKDTKEAYRKVSSNPYYRTVRKYIPMKKSNKNFTKRRRFKKKRGGNKHKYGDFIDDEPEFTQSKKSTFDRNALSKYLSKEKFKKEFINIYDGFDKETFNELVDEYKKNNPQNLNMYDFIRNYKTHHMSPTQNRTIKW